jgi:DNA-binding helix-hairpin-helix protein with protein kinase domain
MEGQGLSTLMLKALQVLFEFVSLRDAEREREESERRQREIATTEENLRRLEEQWRSLCGDSAFACRRKELEEAKVSFEGLKALEEKEWQELAGRFREARLPSHLRTFALEFARIPGLGPAEIAHLAARGVTTAADITPERLMAIWGIDLGLVRGLLLFKGVATRAFSFDPVAGIPGKDRKALEGSQHRRRVELLKTLQAGPLELAELRRQTLAWRDVLGRDPATSVAVVRTGGFAPPRHGDHYTARDLDFPAGGP